MDTVGDKGVHHLSVETRILFLFLRSHMKFYRGVPSNRKLPHGTLLGFGIDLCQNSLVTYGIHTSLLLHVGVFAMRRSNLSQEVMITLSCVNSQLITRSAIETSSAPHKNGPSLHQKSSKMLRDFTRSAFPSAAALGFKESPTRAATTWLYTKPAATSH